MGFLLRAQTPYAIDHALTQQTLYAGMPPSSPAHSSGGRKAVADGTQAERRAADLASLLQGSG